MAVQRPIGVSVAGCVLGIEAVRHLLYGTLVAHAAYGGRTQPLLLLVYAGLGFLLSCPLILSAYGLFTDGNWGRGVGGSALVLAALLALGYFLLLADLLLLIETVLCLIVAGYLLSGRSSIRQPRPDIDETEDSRTVGLPPNH